MRSRIRRQSLSFAKIPSASKLGQVTVAFISRARRARAENRNELLPRPQRQHFYDKSSRLFLWFGGCFCGLGGAFVSMMQTAEAWQGGNTAERNRARTSGGCVLSET